MTGRSELRAIRAGWCGVLAMLMLLVAGGAAAEAVRVDGRNRLALSGFALLRDPGHALAVTDVMGRDADRFEPAPRLAEGHSLGFTADAVWLRVELSVAPQGAGRYFLALDIPNFDRLEAWGSWSSGNSGAPAEADPPPLLRLGDRVADERAMPTRLHAAGIDLPAGEHRLWLRAVSTSSMALPLELWRPGAFWVSEQARIQIHTMLTAVIGILGLGALLLAVALPSLPMAFYAASALATTGHVMAMNGLDVLLWGGHFFFGDISSIVWLVGAGVFGAGFLLTALPLRRHARWAVPVLAVPALLVAGLLAGYPVLDGDTRSLVIPVATNLLLVVLVAGMAASVQCRLAGDRPALYMVFGWLALAAGNLLAGLRNAGVLPWTDATYYLPAYAPMLEMLFFAAMLAAQLRQLRVEKAHAQRALVEALRRNEAELAQRVAERTDALDRANAVLHDRESQLRALLEAAPFPILLSDAAGAVTLYANRRARGRFLGDPDAAPVPRPAADLFCDPADRDRLLTRLERDGGVENAEVELQDSAGNRFWALASMVAIEHEGRPARLVAVNDISRRRQLEQELTKAKEMAETVAGLERAARATQRQFLAMISHEFRTPLTVIAMAAQNLELDAPDATAQERLARIGRAVAYMNGMIDACLLDDRIEGAGLVLRTGSLDLAVLVREIVDATQAASPRHRIAVRTGDLPVTAGDAPLIGVALSNLMENAVKYSPPDSAVEVTLERDGREAVLTVADRGRGVPDTERERIFEKYYRCVDTGGVPGAGLGLYLTRSIVAAHGGTVAVRDRPGGGTLFVIRLPLQDALASDGDAREAA
ncbi:ATP-binding protein (plasmid) [Azospirillum sp. A26]|uniref:sensor histidine kinase n=1 Tax=Azospirillum sp. A26 TaxID=3160607 RepID=UPI00367298CD